MLRTHVGPEHEGLQGVKEQIGVYMCVCQKPAYPLCPPPFRRLDDMMRCSVTFLFLYHSPCGAHVFCTQGRACASPTTVSSRTPCGLHDDDALTNVPYVATSGGLASTGCVHRERRDVRFLEYGMSVQAAPVPFSESCLVL